MYFLTDLGSSWAPVVVDSQAELDLIENGNKQLSEVATFYLGGSTDRGHQEHIVLSQYKTDSSGNKAVLTMENFLNEVRHFGTMAQWNRSMLMFLHVWCTICHCASVADFTENNYYMNNQQLKKSPHCNQQVFQKCEFRAFILIK